MNSKLHQLSVEINFNMYQLAVIDVEFMKNYLCDDFYFIYNIHLIKKKKIIKMIHQNVNVILNN